jgi:hypothetical protein
VPSRLPLERYCGAMTTVMALRSRAKRRPPNSRARTAACTTNKRRGQRGNEANGAEGVSEDGAADVDEERNEWRLIDVSPGEVIAAGDVIELVAEVAVAVVEVDVEEKLG